MTADDLHRTIGWLSVASSKHATGAAVTDRAIAGIVARLMTTTGWEDEEVVQARHAVVEDLVQGRYGHGPMLDAFLALEADITGPQALDDQEFVCIMRGVAQVGVARAGLYPLDLLSADALDYRAFLAKLIWSKQPWTDAVLVDLIAGRYGEHLQGQAIAAAIAGPGLGSAVDSFAADCVSAGRLDLFKKVIDLGLPASLKGSSKLGLCQGATTPTGQWFELLVKVGTFPVATTRGKRMLPNVPEFILNHAETTAGVTLAEVLARHDPEHKHIRRLAGTAAGAVIMQSRMRGHIDARLGSQASPEMLMEAAMRRRSRAL
ncbi:hypothetical protein [Roseateles asaccharophilus]|uniref:hypothetical protein n=1 Tax=Roseateles asaccharophilus TaxID=582607 RepID=UPI003850FAE5